MATAVTVRPTFGAAQLLSNVSARPNLSAFIIVACDFVTLALCFALCVIGRRMTGGQINWFQYLNLWPILGCFTAAYWCSGLYPGITLSPVVELRRTAAANTIVFGCLGTLTLLTKNVNIYSRGVFVIAWLFSIAVVPLSRASIRHALGPKRWWGRDVVVLASGGHGRSIVQTLLQHPHIGLKPAVVLDESNGHPRARETSTSGSLAQIAVDLGLSHVVIALQGVPSSELLALVEQYASIFTHLFLVSELPGLSSIATETQDISHFMTLQIRQNLLMRGPRFAKRTIDVCLSMFLVFLTFPLFLVIATLINLESEGPVFYGHTRIGQKHKRFKVWKFRTMKPDANRLLADYLSKNPEQQSEWAQNHKLKNDPRVTKLGKFLRKTSLDELPQLWNVLSGDMSLVGPRPIVTEEVMKYGRRFQLYARVTPGVTGLWQISGRNDTTYSQRVELDTYYVRNWSPWLDLYVLTRTVGVVARARGAY